MSDPRIILRSEWGATVPTGPAQPQPASEVWIHWTVTTPTADPYRDAKTIERIGKARFGRFSYSWCYHPPTRSFIEGAGPTIGAHTAGHNTKGLAVSIIGGPGHDDFPHLAEDVAAFLRGRIAAGQLRPGSPVQGHRDQKSTECPGAKAYAAIPRIRTYLASAPPTASQELTVSEAADLQKQITANKKAQDKANGSVVKALGDLAGQIDALAARADRNLWLFAEHFAKVTGATDAEVAELRAILEPKG